MAGALRQRADGTTYRQSGRQDVIDFFNIGGVRDSVGGFLGGIVDPIQRNVFDPVGDFLREGFGPAGTAQGMGDTFYPTVPGREQIINALNIPQPHSIPSIPVTSRNGFPPVPQQRPIAGAGFGVQGPVYNEEAATRSDVITSAREYLSQQQQDLWNRQQALLQLDISDIEAQYGGNIDALEKQLASLQDQFAGSSDAYDDFRGGIDRIYQNNPVQMAALKETAIYGDVQKVYNDATGETLAVLEKIDADGNPALAEKLTSELRTVEELVDQQLRVDINNTDNLHAAAQNMASAISKSAYADDAYEAARSESILDAQFRKAIDDQRDALAAERAKQTAAIENAARRSALEFESYEPDFDVARDEVMKKHFRDQGLNEHEVDEMMLLLNDVMSSDPSAQLNARTFGKAWSTFNTRSILNELGGYGDAFGQRMTDLMSLEAGYDEGLQRNITNEEVLASQQQAASLEAWMSNVDLGRIFRKGSSTELAQLREFLTGIGGLSESQADLMIYEGGENSDDFLSRTDVGYTTIKNAYDMWTGFDEDWGKIRAGGAVYDESQLYVAPDGGAFPGYVFPIVADVWHSRTGAFKMVEGKDRSGPGVHQGVDIGAYRGSPVVAPVSGVVSEMGYDPGSGGNASGLGYYVKLTDPKTGFVHVFAHMDTLGDIARGDQIPVGQGIGTVGATSGPFGSPAAFGPHLHYEVRGYENSPMDFLIPTGGTNVRDAPTDYGVRVFDPVTDASQTPTSSVLR